MKPEEAEAEDKDALDFEGLTPFDSFGVGCKDAGVPQIVPARPSSQQCLVRELVPIVPKDDHVCFWRL